MAPVADYNVAQPCRPLDYHAGPDSALADDLHVRADRGVAADDRFRPDIGGRRIDQRDPFGHQAAIRLLADLSFHSGQLLTRIDSSELPRLRGVPGVNLDSTPAGDRNYI